MKKDDTSIPHSTEAEQSVIGAILLDNRAFDVIGATLRAEHFYRDDHRVIYDQIVKLLMAGAAADMVTVFAALQHAGKDERAGGLAYLNAIASNTPGASNVKRYAEIVIDRFKRRELIAIAGDIRDMVLQPDGSDASTILNRAAERLEGLATTRQGKGPVLLADAMVGVLERLQDQYNGNAPAATSTGFKDLDAKLGGGVRGSQLIVLAGRPSMGKTALAMAIGDHVAIDKPVVAFSMEMPGEQLHQRSISRNGSIPIGRMLDGSKFTDEDWPKLTHAVQKIQGHSLYVDDEAALPLSEIRARCRKLRREVGALGLIIVDYLGLMGDDGRQDNRSAAIGANSRGLKALAKEMDAPVIALSQLSRKCEERPNKRPLCSDLRDSGEIEQDADVILFVYRDEVYNPDTQDKGIAEIIIGKHRNGEIGRVAMAYDGNYTRFSDLAHGGMLSKFSPKSASGRSTFE